MYKVIYRRSDKQLLYENPILDNTDLQTPQNIEVVGFGTLEEAKEFISENNLVYIHSVEE